MKIENIEKGRRLFDYFDRIKKCKQDHKKGGTRVDRGLAIMETLYLLDDENLKMVEDVVLQKLDEQEKDVVKQIEEL